MDDFSRVVNDLALVDVKPDHGLFTWFNNRRGQGLVRERLNRFFVSSTWLSMVPLLAFEVIWQAQSDHDLILLDTTGREVRNRGRDSRLRFRIEECWDSDNEAKMVIQVAWNSGNGDILWSSDFKMLT